MEHNFRDLAPFNWDASPVDRERDSFAACSVEFQIRHVGEFGHVYEVSIRNDAWNAGEGDYGHALDPIVIECTGPVDTNSSANRLAYVSAENETDAEKIRHALRGLIAQVARHHADGYCVWGSCRDAEKFYGEWLNRDPDWSDTHLQECSHCLGFGWTILGYERPAEGAHPNEGLQKESCYRCDGRGLVYFDRECVGSDSYVERSIPDGDQVPPYIPRCGAEPQADGKYEQRAASDYNADCRAFEASRRMRVK